MPKSRRTSIQLTSLLPYALVVGWAFAPTTLATLPTPEPAPPAGGAAPASKPLVELNSRLFPKPPQLVDNVNFWTMVYATYHDNQVLVHDELHLGVIYAVLDFSELDAKEVNPVRQEQIRRQQVREATEKYRTILLQLAAGQIAKSWPEDSARVRAAFAKIPGTNEKFRHAAERIRTQTCLRNRFADAIVRSGYYMPEIERTFNEQGLPIELTRLPFVESLFQWNARSNVAAGGIWQFMPGTARLFGLRSQAEFDERYDPLRATQAAARLLRDNYRALGVWPLAVTAYNHGQGGMRRAVRVTGSTDIGVIATRYTGRAFGFASRNFYAELLAAAHVYANRDHYFPGVVPAPPLEFESFSLPHYVKATDLARSANLDLAKLQEMNPALTKTVWEGRMRLPRGYQLKVPKGSLPAVVAAYGAMPAEAKSAAQGGGRHIVRSGDTLGKIAAQYGTTANALVSANRLSNAHRLSIGQVLVVPGREDKTPPAAVATKTATSPASPPPAATSTVAAAPAAPNGAPSGSSANPAPANPAPANTAQAPPTEQAKSAANQHIVRRGDTLSSIAKKYGVSVEALKRANRLRNHLIQPAQVLTIP